jgi:uncharacterized protein YbjT (DUF2867 family)
MEVAIAGAGGKVATRLIRRLAARQVGVVGLIRNPDDAQDLAALGARPVVCDLERAEPAAIAQAIAGADAVVFAAGAGPGSGAERKLTIDRDGAIKLLRAAESAGVRRYLMVSSIGAEDPPRGAGTSSVYLRAKAEADAAVQASDLEWTIVRPGVLTDDEGTGHVRIDLNPFHGRVPRDDVAAVLDSLLHTGRSARLILYVNGGPGTLQESLQAAIEPGAAPDAG